MFCPKCGTHFDAGWHYCRCCGNALPYIPAPTEKGSHSAPILVMVIMLGIGLTAYFLLPM